ncbi:MAG: HEAT repeat domain-containing protein [Planctomycetaceae bacterium]
MRSPAPLLILLASAAAAAPDALSTYKEEETKVRRADGAFWREFQRRYSQALLAWRDPLEAADAKPDEHREAVYDYSVLRGLYEEYVALERQGAQAAAALAASDHPKAFDRLLDDLLDAAKAIDAVDKELAESRPKAKRYLFDPRPGVLRHGLEFRLLGLVRSLASLPRSGPLLADQGWKQAQSKDGSRSVVRRVAILDALGLAGDAAGARPLLESVLLREKEASLRIAALEALLRYGPESTKLLVPLLDDANPVVRRALVQGVRGAEKRDAAFLAPFARALATAEGALRGDLVGALESLTRQEFGYAPARWAEWAREYQAEIDAGRFRAEAVEVIETKREAIPDAVSFYGIATASRRIVYLIDGSLNLSVPSDVEFQRTRYILHWPGSARDWHAAHPPHRAIVGRQLARSLEAFPEQGLFAVGVLHADFDTEFLGAPQPVPPSARIRREIEEAIAKLPARGWCAQLEGLMAAMALGGRDPATADGFADTVFLLADGSPAGGRYMTAESVLAAFRRLNRFRRVTVHAIRICNAKEEGETLLKGLAEASGGSYVWASSPPAPEG